MPGGRGAGRSFAGCMAPPEPDLRARYTELLQRHEDLYNEVLVTQGRLLELSRLLAGILHPESKEST